MPSTQLASSTHGFVYTEITPPSGVPFTPGYNPGVYSNSIPTGVPFFGPGITLTQPTYTAAKSEIIIDIVPATTIQAGDLEATKQGTNFTSLIELNPNVKLPANQLSSVSIPSPAKGDVINVRQSSGSNLGITYINVYRYDYPIK